MIQSFDAFLALRHSAGLEYLQGNGAAVVALSAQTGPSTFFTPDGGLIEGCEHVNQEKARSAARFGPNGTSEWLCKDHGESGDLGYWVGYQQIAVQVGDAMHRSSFRVTEVYRRIDGEWKILHRHASRSA